ncbi:hypothetical protein D3C80_1933280 [compost metagenome]
MFEPGGQWHAGGEGHHVQAVSQVQAQQHKAFTAGDAVAGVEHRQGQRGDTKHHGQVEIQGIG